MCFYFFHCKSRIRIFRAYNKGIKKILNPLISILKNISRNIHIFYRIKTYLCIGIKTFNIGNTQDMKLLIIEDEPQLSDSIKKFLRNEDYLCEQAYSYIEADEKISAYEYDCILLDLMLPGGTGLDLLKKIRESAPKTGVIIVSAKDSLDDKIAGLKLGADDYIAKPFHLSELSMRIFALLRRKCFTVSNTIKTGSVTVDLLQRSVDVGDRTLELTKSEYELLLFLIENRNRVISKSALAEHLSGDVADMMDDFNFVYAHIKNLKSKLADAGVTDCIRTYYGAGYKWIEE